MAATNATAEAIGALVAFFLPHCSDQSTMLELKNMASDFKQWCQAHKLFGRIRNKTLRADDAKDNMLQCQYSFEEICAKTLYNMADHHEGFNAAYLPPFDEDSPFWVLPIAIGFAHRLGLKGLPFGSVILRIDDV
jgi:hypothetical protein